MEDNTYEEFTIKINWAKDAYYNTGMWKYKNTNQPINGKYENENETIFYFKNGKRHNENGPAFITKDGYEAYCINGKTHRIDGPARIFSDGSIKWCINGYDIDNETINNWLTENDIPLDWNIWTDSDKMLFALHWNDYE